MVRLGKQQPSIWALKAAGRSDVGRVRQLNEDSILVARELGLYAVADGMGGHSAGDVASKLVVESMAEICKRDRFTPPPLQEGGEDAEQSALGRFLTAMVVECNERVFAHSGRCMTEGGMGSTIVAMLFDAPASVLHVAHAGDSRCYRLRSGAIEQLTVDHSIRNEALRLNPDLPQDVLDQLPANLVTRALGSAEPVKPEWNEFEVEDGDVYLLCSDGLSGEIADAELAELVAGSSNLDQACERLVDAANLAGGKDNISVVLVSARRQEVSADTLFPDPKESEPDTQPELGEEGAADGPSSRGASVHRASGAVRSDSDGSGQRAGSGSEDSWLEELDTSSGLDSDLPEPPTPREFEGGLTPSELHVDSDLDEDDGPSTPITSSFEPLDSDLPEPPTPRQSFDPGALSLPTAEDWTGSKTTEPQPTDVEDHGASSDDDAHTSPDWNEAEQSDLPEPPADY